MSKITGDGDAYKNFGDLPENLKKKIKKIFNINSAEMQRYLREQRLTGGTSDTQLGVRSGQLRGSVRIIGAHEEGTSIKAGVSVGTVYARVHVGPKGQQTTIRPKHGQYLAIPLEAAKTAAGVARGSPRYGPWTETFVARSKKGNLIIFGKKLSYQGVKVGGVRVKGLAIRRVGQNIIPLFVLKREVTIKARIDPFDALRHIAPKLMSDLREIGIMVGGG